MDTKRDNTREGPTIPTSTNLLLGLPNELVVMVASYLDLASFLALASTSNKIKETLVSKHQWTMLLQKTRMNGKRLDKREYRKRFRAPKTFPVFPNMEDLEKYLAKEREDWTVFVEERKAYMEREKKDMEEEVEKLALFLKSVDDVDGSLLLALLHTILERFPIDKSCDDLISLSCPCGVLHAVGPLGFALLEKAETIASGSQVEPLQDLVTFMSLEDLVTYKPLQDSVTNKCDQVGPVLARALRQKCKVKSVIFRDILLGSELEVILKVFKRCESWSIVKYVDLIGWEEEYEDTDNDKIIDFLHGLAEETTRGRIENLGLTDKIIAQCTLDQLENLWKITRGSLLVRCWRCQDYTYIWINQPEEEEWKNVVSSIREIHANKQAHYSRCG